MLSTRAMQAIFSEAAPSYERVNYVLTLGLDIRWRRRAAAIAAADGGARWLDVCTGTGDMARCLQRLAPPETQVFAVDLTPAMLARAVAKPEASRIGLAAADVRALPFPDATFDLVTISFATRNINTSREALLAAFREFCRVLRPGGRFVCVETSQPGNPVVRWGFHAYVQALVKPVGQLLSGSRTAYAYLAHTIPRFYRADELADLLREGGFATVRTELMLMGVAAAHIARADACPSQQEHAPNG